MEWIDRIDEIAKQANEKLGAASRRSTNQSGDYGIGQALVAVAAQLQYANAIAAAQFYMEHVNEEES